ncbi:hypothetical protein [Aliikangiella sp. IMCC44632]
MSEDVYAAPQSNLGAGDTDFQMLIEPLLATKLWVRLCSVLGYIFTVFIILGGIGLMFGANVGGLQSAGYTAGIGAAYLIMGIFYFFPSLYLGQYASAISRAAESKSAEDIKDALTRQKSFWKFVGVLVAIMFAIMLLGIISAITIPMMM